MNILGLNCGHNSTTCLLQSDQITHCINEERLSRKKNQLGFPQLSTKYLLRQTHLSPSDLDLVVIATRHPYSHQINFDIDQYKGSELRYEITTNFNLSHEYLAKLTSDHKRYSKKLFRQAFNSAIARQVKSNYLHKLGDIPSNKLIFVDHHLLHAYSTLANLSFSSPWLVFTLDAEGDGKAATINIFDGKDLQVVQQNSNADSLGYLYLAVTKFLNMKPNEHEYKVMGLAPYAAQLDTKPIENEFLKIIKLTPSNRFKAKFFLPNLTVMMNYLERHFRGKGYRFDMISAAIQNVTEDLISTWIEQAMKKYSIYQVAVSGGVFLNVKSNHRLTQLPKLKKLWIMPSPGDDSLAIGSCIYGHHLLTGKLPQPITHLYLGPEINQQINQCIPKLSKSGKYKISCKRNIEKTIARLLYQGHIVARCKGRMEWGARALGNRSILARPDDLYIIKQLNHAIKKRDFWMPFAPSILSEDMKRYVINPKNTRAPYMVLAFDTTKIGKQHLAAAMHPYDETVRPQEVIQSWNPDYHRLISEFRKLTGIGAILNTSFNLHGYPIVCSTQDALHVFENSDLKYLALENHLIEKIN